MSFYNHLHLFCGPKLLIFVGAFLFGRRISVEEGMGEKNPGKPLPEVFYQSQWEENVPKEDRDEEEKHFCMLMERLGANSVFEK